MRIVIDTNILVAAFLNPNGYTAVFMDKVLGNHYEIVVTESILAEYEDVLSRPQFGFPKCPFDMGLWTWRLWCGYSNACIKNILGSSAPVPSSP